MKMNKYNSLHWLLIIFLLLSEVIFVKSFTNHQNEKLSRKRRYLIFPEGSSLQLIYDQIIGVVDKVNLFILGITVALAWELPSKVEYAHINEKLQEAYQGISSSAMERIGSSDLDTDNYYFNRKNTLYNDEDTSYLTNSIKDQKFDNTDGEDPIRRLSNDQQISYADRQLNNLRTPANWTRNNLSKFYVNEKPVLKPISDKSDNTKINYYKNDFYRKHHRVTRQKLFNTIEKYLDAKGLHGVQCVLRAVCETEKQKKLLGSGTFIGEILKMIFSLPPSHEEDSHLDIHRRYDHARLSGNCEERFKYCQYSLFENRFLY